MEKYRFTFSDLSEKEQKSNEKTSLINEAESSNLTPHKHKFKTPLEYGLFGRLDHICQRIHLGKILDTKIICKIKKWL